MKVVGPSETTSNSTGSNENLFKVLKAGKNMVKFLDPSDNLRRPYPHENLWRVLDTNENLEGLTLL